MSISKKSTNNTHTRSEKVSIINAFSRLFAILLFGGSVLFFSVKTATANETKKFDFPETLTEADKTAIQNSNGKYLMNISTCFSDGMTYWYILVWDTTTGKSKFYYGSPRDKATKLGASQFQLPSNPL